MNFALGCHPGTTDHLAYDLVNLPVSFIEKTVNIYRKHLGGYNGISEADKFEVT